MLLLFVKEKPLATTIDRGEPTLTDSLTTGSVPAVTGSVSVITGQDAPASGSGDRERIPANANQAATGQPATA